MSSGERRSHPLHRHAARVLESEPSTHLPRAVPVQVGELSPAAFLRLRQEISAAGGVFGRVSLSTAVLLATPEQFRNLVLRATDPSLRAIGEEVERAVQAFRHRGVREVVGAHQRFPLGDRPRVMGVVNVTPDSFSDGGQFLEPAAAVAHGERLVAEGADIIDIGGESTRPGAAPVSSDVEWQRVEPVIRGLAGRVRVPLSIDTRHPEVAAKAVEAGADLVNDVEGLRSEEMRAVVARSGAAVVVMHMRGTPETMQTNLTYTDVRADVFRWLADATDAARAAGIHPERILVDPGLGFGKSPGQSLELLTHAGELRCLGYPVVLGASRKSFLGWATGEKEPGARLESGLAAAVVAAQQGVELVRTHDVGPTVRALALVAAATRGGRGTGGP